MPFWYLQLLISRNKKLWIFGAWYGERFSDNSMYLFKYIHENYPDIRAIWITTNKDIFNSNKTLGYETYMKWSLKGVWYCLKAKFVFVTSRKQDVNEFFINGSTTVNLWHGSPLKKIGADDKYSQVNSFFYSKIVKNIFSISYEFNYDFVISNAAVFTDKMAASFKVDNTQVLETGCPRNDVFYNTKKDSFNLNVLERFPNAKLVYYLPTFRNSETPKNIFTQPDFNINFIEDFLRKENIVLINKGHFVESKKGITSTNPLSRIIHLKDSDTTSDINFMLKDADALITDYSSVFFDFLLTERPMIFAAFDLQEYMSQSRELYFEYDNAISGPMAKNWKEIMFHLKNVWCDINNNILIKEKNTLYNKYHDANNSERVVQSLIGLSNKK
ncbi:CDP-glycerol glycerophosphotransferase family protein [uncultured Maribacter sp.]|uniref:CDP-glycerol glycerophosphotransferase family protein n=1 Tax=uncultured Maribacter sp. TaxID=431308 RepID=UPI002630FC9A|nr:CDP-glycerol glycerophosphotransferase family protein [uncultured Maribacter sp.]